MTDRQPCDELDLLALADGLLESDLARKHQVEAAIASSPSAAARLRDYRAQTGALRAALDARVAEPVPERLHAVLDRQDGARSYRSAASIAVLVLSAGLGGWLIGQDDEDQTRQALLDESYRQFVTRAAGDAVAASTVSSGESQEPFSWIEDDVSIRIRTPDLSSEGFALIDKRALRDGEDQVVRLDYAAMDGRAFSLFLAPRWDDRPAPITEVERGDVSLAYWHEGPLASSIATRLPQDDMHEVAEAVRRAMRDDTIAPPAVLRPDFRRSDDERNGVLADTLGAPLGDERPSGAKGVAATPDNGG